MTQHIRMALKASAAPLALILGQASYAQDTVSIPIGANTEPAATQVASDDGFVISIDGAGPATTNSAPPSTQRRADIALSRADVRVQYDGLSNERRLDALVLSEGPARVGDTVRVQSQLNYPAFVQRGELRVQDLAAPGGPRTVLVVPISPNGTVSFQVPEGRDLAVSHRVYDARGRFDETGLRPLVGNPGAAEIEALGDRAIEQGTTTLVRQRIPVFGGAVTVSGDSLSPGARVDTLGETIQADPSGKFVVQRILPPGDQSVIVQSQNAYVERIITIPNSDWFYTATVDLTFGRRFGDRSTPSGQTLPLTYDSGRLAGFAKGRTANGWTITASADTGERELSEVFRDLDKKDADDALRRAALQKSYPTFGDDSTIEDGAPTDGRFYLKAEKNGSHILWGNYNATVAGSKYLRNERRLYGLQGVYRSDAQTTRGQSRASVEVYAASPERLPGREVFRGTGGSIYFLQRQDIGIASETVTVEVRDGNTGRVLETRILTEGRDYFINYTQGIITLASPLASSLSSGLIVNQPGGDLDINLIAQYEFTPTATDVDGLSYGARAEAWVTDNLRIGVTGQVEQTDIADQTAVGADIRYEFGENSYAALEYAETEGPGFGSSVSSNGGLVITSTGSAGSTSGTGEAVSADVSLDFGDLGLETPGSINAYYERRGAGFSTLDYQTTDAEELWGLSVNVDATDRLSWNLRYDDFESDSGRIFREGEVALRYKINDVSTVEAGIAHLDKVTPGRPGDETGSRTDAAVKYTRTVSDALTWYGFGQATLDRSGGLPENNRVGIGARYQLTPNWTVDAEVSEGNLGTAGEVLLTYQSDGYDSAYFGYRLEPGREFSGVSLTGSDQGTFVAGGKRRLSANLDFFAENTYDIFGRHKALTSGYGVEYRATEELIYSASVDIGRVDDGPDDFDRNAISLGVRYSDDERLEASAKIEYRLDEGTIGGSVRDAEAFFLSGGLRYKLDEERRILASLEYAETQSDGSSVLDGTYGEFTLGYAIRPIEDDRFNLLFQYRFLNDMIGQEIDGTTVRGPRQRSHIVSVDGEYDLNQKWTLGAKIGARFSETSQSATSAFEENNAWLVVVNTRYHVTHKWDLLLEARHMEAEQASFAETGFLAAGYRHMGNNLKVGVGYNFGSFSDDLTDLTFDDEGMFLNVIAKF